MTAPHTRPVQVIRHVGFEGLGTMERDLPALGLPFEYLDAPHDDLATAREAKLLVVMGGPISVNDAHRFPYITP